MIYRVTIGDRTLEVDVRGSEVTVDGEAVDVDFGRLDGGPVRSLLLDGASYRLVADGDAAGAWRLRLAGQSMIAEVVDERTHAVREMTGGPAVARGPRPIHAPMPGMVVRVEVARGDRVAAGQGVVIVEAMKMENELRAGGPGIVERVHVVEGQAVEKDQLLVDLAPLTESEAP